MSTKSKLTETWEADWTIENENENKDLCFYLALHILMQIQFTKLHPDAHMPEQNNPSDAGYDLRSTEAYTLAPGERKLFKTGIAAAIPEWYYGRIAPRSGMAYKEGIDVLAGVVDSNYRWDIWVILINFGSEPKEVLPWDKIAQYVITPCVSWVERVEVENADDLEDSSRAAKGFGSSGR